FSSESGLFCKTRCTLRDAVLVDTVIMPGGAAVQMGEVSRKIAEWLSNRAVSIRRIASVCGGIYAVAKAGLLETRKITTHWKLVQDFRRKFPRVDVDPVASFIKDGKFYSCGGGTAAIEKTLALIQEDYGARGARDRLSKRRLLCARL